MWRVGRSESVAESAGTTVCPVLDIYNMKRSTNDDVVKVEPKINFERSENHTYKPHF
jgi:hypothetical protein